MLMIETTNNTKLFGIMGYPISHTLSPAMHSFMAAECGIEMTYLPFEVLDLDLKNALDDAIKKGVLGLNITAPHKISVMEHLDEITYDARRISAVNTVLNKDGKWHGYNTDGEGFVESLRFEGHSIKDKHIVIMGAGGSARALCYSLGKSGAKSLTLVARNKEKIHAIGKMVTQDTDALFFDCMDASRQFDFVINATPLGMHPNENINPCNFMDSITGDTVCCDLIYNPKETCFLKAAEERKATTINGLGMLVCQGILAFELFHDITLDRKLFYDLLMKKLSNF